MQRNRAGVERLLNLAYIRERHAFTRFAFALQRHVVQA